MLRLLLPALLLPALAAAQPLATDDEKSLYAAGYSLGKTAALFSPSKAEIEILRRGWADAIAGKKAVIDVDERGPQISTLMRSRIRTSNEEFAKKAAKEPGATKLASGLIYTEVKAGTGPSPKATDSVRVHYRGRLVDGVEFDSSYARNQPAEFPLNGVIPCWTEGLQKIKVGGKAKLICPSSIAYGDAGRAPKIPPAATLQFDVELLEILPPTPVSTTDGGKPPAEALPDAGKK